MIWLVILYECVDREMLGKTNAAPLGQTPFCCNHRSERLFLKSIKGYLAFMYPMHTIMSNVRKYHAFCKNFLFGARAKIIYCMYMFCRLNYRPKGGAKSKMCISTSGVTGCLGDETQKAGIPDIFRIFSLYTFNCKTYILGRFQTPTGQTAEHWMCNCTSISLFTRLAI